MKKSEAIYLRTSLQLAKIRLSFLLFMMVEQFQLHGAGQLGIVWFVQILWIAKYFIKLCIN